MIKKIIFVLIIIALLGGGYWYVSQKSVTSPTGVDTSDWQTFRNEKYGYEVKYPSSAVFKNTNQDLSPGVQLESALGVPNNLISEKNQQVGSSFGLFVSLDISPGISNPANLSLTDWLEENIFSGHRSITPAGGREMTLAGEPAYYIEQYHNGKNGGLYAYTRYTIYVLHNGNLYQISGVKLPQSPTPAWLAHPYYQYLERSIPISEAILNSFRFVN